LIQESLGGEDLQLYAELATAMPEMSVQELCELILL